MRGAPPLRNRMRGWGSSYIKFPDNGWYETEHDMDDFLKLRRFPLE